MTTQSKLLDQVRQVILSLHYSYRTEQAYVSWIKQFILFQNKQHPQNLNEKDVAEFLTHLAIDRNVAPNTQNQALNALVFLYKRVLDNPLNHISGVKRASARQKLPVVPTQLEISTLLSNLSHPHWLVAALMYGGAPLLVHYGT